MLINMVKDVSDTGGPDIDSLLVSMKVVTG